VSIPLPRLICIDLDQTLLPVDSHQIPAINLRALRACHSAGIELAIISGRRRTTLQPYIEQIDLPLFVGSNSGTQLWSYPAWQRLDSQPLPHALVEQAAALLAPHSLNLYFGWDDADRRDFAWLRRAESKLHTRYIAEFGEYATTISSLDDLPEREVLQLSMPGEEALVRELCTAIEAEFGNSVFVECVSWPRMPCYAMEVFHPEGHKGWALSRFAELLGISMEQTMAIGDDANDLPMLSRAGHSVAMGHAVPQAIELAHSVLPDEGESALGRWLLELLG
jgi:Cof subfamily protein (haloacid dehalogenase superfamily)